MYTLDDKKKKRRKRGHIKIPPDNREKEWKRKQQDKMQAII